MSHQRGSTIYNGWVSVPAKSDSLFESSFKKSKTEITNKRIDETECQAAIMKTTTQQQVASKRTDLTTNTGEDCF